MHWASCVSEPGTPVQPKCNGAMACGQGPLGSSARVTIGSQRARTAKGTTLLLASSRHCVHGAVPVRRCSGIVRRRGRGLRSARGPWGALSSGACPGGLVSLRGCGIRPRLERWSRAVRQPRSCSSTGGRLRASVGKSRWRRGVVCCSTITPGTAVGRTVCPPNSSWRPRATGHRKGPVAPRDGGLPS
jgi:hypothetical protein